MGDPYPGKIKYEGGKPWTLSYEAVVASLALADWPESLWAKGAAVISAESNRTVNIYNTYLEGHYGLMQIGKKQHPSLFKNGILWIHPVLNCSEGYRIFKSQGWGAWEAASNGRYTGSLLQATAAVKVVQGKIRGLTGDARSKALYALYGKRDGEAFMQLLEGAAIGSINKGLAESGAAAGNALGTTIEETGTATLEAAAHIQQASGIIGAVQLMIGGAKWLGDPANWLRVGQVVVGGGLLLAGISIAAKPAMAAGAKTAAAVAPVGRVATKAIKTVGKVAA